MHLSGNEQDSHLRNIADLKVRQARRIQNVADDIAVLRSSLRRDERYSLLLGVPAIVGFPCGRRSAQAAPARPASACSAFSRYF